LNKIEHQSQINHNIIGQLAKEYTMMKYSIVPYFEVLFAVIIWGASFIATKVIIVDITFPI